MGYTASDTSSLVEFRGYGARRRSAGNDAQPTHVDEADKVCSLALQRTSVISSFPLALFHHHTHSSCSDSSPPLCFSGRLWGTDADLLTRLGQMAARMDGGSHH